ncbi:MAG: VOC family protein [Rikenellaceae bacterium]
MKITAKLDHVNINVTDLTQSIKFYNEALGLQVVERKAAEDGSFELVYLGDGAQNVRLELTWLKEHTEAYDLGENESHLCFKVAEDYDTVREYHRSRGWVCYENEEMGLYFINDPDDYWIEVLPVSWK